VRQHWVAISVATVAASLALAACSSSGSGGGSSSSKSVAPPAGSSTSASSSAATTTDASKAQSAAAMGGMAALVAAAQKEGTLNIIAVPRTWAGYGAIIDAFHAKYGIKINSENPNGASGDEINALKSTKGQASAPDVVDVGNSYALSGAQEGDFAPYKVATWADIPDEQKDAGGLWYSDYGGYISIGCNAAKVGGTCPKSIKELDNPKYKGDVALNGDPTIANAAFEAVWAAALANGGSADNIQPGIDFFKKLNSEGIFNKTKVTPATVASGATPIVLDWDYLNVGNAAALKKQGVTWTTADPPDGVVNGFYAQAVSINAAHPAAGRLWEEYLYSVEGQNGWLKGYARPIELPAMLKAKTADPAAAALLPKVTDNNPFIPTQDQVTKAKAVVTQKWAAAVS
jgi:putative spermidine/putrescine transport system substrate-binding protein